MIEECRCGWSQGTEGQHVSMRGMTKGLSVCWKALDKKLRQESVL
jgi:hypothetical protein